MADVVETPQTVADLVIAREHDAHAGLRFEGRTWAWVDIVEEARRRAALLDAARVPGPFHIGVLLENVPEYVFLLTGAALARATIVGINPTRRGDELARDIRHTDCQLVLTDKTHGRLLQGLELGIPEARVLDVDSPDYESRLPSSAAWHPASHAAPDDLYLLLFTSGSSGAPKAVRMTQGRAVRASDSLLCSRDDVPYCAMPLFHGNALNACVFPALRVGAMITLRRKFSASEFIDDVRTSGCTYFSSIGRVLNYVLATPERPDDADNPLKLVLGPESSAADMVEFKRRFNCPVFAGYGSSENAIILLPPPGSARGALGVAPEGDDVVVLDRLTGEECPTALFDDAGKLVNGDEAIGELVGRNALERFEGYYNNADAGDDRSRNGWYWSGDLAYRDEAGIFWFAGRTADWIRVDGENFAAAPIERILARFSGVREAVVYGVPDERNAEDQVMACLELSGHVEFDPAAFTSFLDTQADLGTKWAPRFLRIATSLPTTGTNKIDKKPLRSDAWNTDDPIWWRRDRRLPAYAAFTPSDAAGLNQALAENRRIHI